MKRRTFVGMAGLSVLQGFAKSSDPPNVLVLMSDQHSPHVLGCYGDRTVRTPHLDRLAQRGVLFENAYCQAPLCVPSRTSFLTGQQPSQTQVWTNTDTLPSDTATFAHALGAAGYQTALIGRMHFNGPDQLHGFDQRLVGDLTPAFANGNIPLTPDLRPGATNSSRKSVTIAGPGSTAYRAFDADVSEATIEYLRQVRQGAEPFCAVSGFVLPHSPFVCSREDWRYYYDRVSIPRVPSGYFDTLHPAVRKWRSARGVVDITDEEVRRARAAYYGLVTEFDRHVGRILDALQESGLDQNTIVIYTSDHGEMAGENGLWWKLNFYEGSVRVPLIVSCPSRLASGHRVSRVVSLVDIAPTLSDLANTDALPEAAGRSLLPFLRAESPAWEDVAFSELPRIREIPATRMIRSGKWKLVHFDGMRPQLFDLEADPQEFHDLGESEQHRDVREELRSRLLRDWSAAEIQGVTDRRAPHYDLIRRWAQRRQPALPQSWKPPAGVNRFPDPE